MSRHVWVVEYADKRGPRSHIWSSAGGDSTFSRKTDAVNDARMSSNEGWLLAELKFRVVKYTPDEPYIHSLKR